MNEYNDLFFIDPNININYYYSFFIFKLIISRKII